MAFCVTLAHSRGDISEAERDEWFDTIIGVGLTVDHELFDYEMLQRGMAAILKTRDGLQRLVLPKPLGKCYFANDVSDDEFVKVLKQHKDYVNQRFPATKGGNGVDAYADAGDLGADPEVLKKKQEEALRETGVGRAKKAQANGTANGSANAPLKSAPNGMPAVGNKAVSASA